MTTSRRTLSPVDYLFLGLLVVIFGGIVLHAPLTVSIGTLFPAADLAFKAWKELLMVPAVMLAGYLVWSKGRASILASPLVILTGIYILLHILLAPLFFSNATSVIAGLLIDLRYVVFFGLVVIAVQLYPQLRAVFLKVFVAGALLVGTFALLQVFVLPPDILSSIGYGELTISPYLTVDENPEYIRINSTLRGPNPLGAYAVIVLALLVAYVARVKRQWRPSAWVVAGLLALGSGVALWASYSRSALVAAVVALGIVFLLTVGRRLNRWVWVGLFVAAFAVAGGVYAARDTSFVSNVILHENEGTGAEVSSNEGHVESLVDGTERLVVQPLGAGIGSTGSASLYTEEPVIIENQYLFIAHETGWMGLVIFLMLFGGVLWISWKQRADFLALGVLASGVGLALIGILLPVWVDDTVAIIWWGLAGLVVGGYYGGTIHKKTKRTA